MSKTNVFLSFSFEEENLKLVNAIKDSLEKNESTINYSEKKDWSINSDKNIWENLLSRIHGSSITLLLLTKDLLTNNRYKISSVNDFDNSGWVYKEISASLRNWKNNSINGVLVIYDDEIISILRKQNWKIAKIIDRNRHNHKITKKDYIDVISLSDFIKDASGWIKKTKEKRKDQIENQSYKIKYDFHN